MNNEHPQGLIIVEAALTILIVDAIKRQSLDEAIALAQLALQVYQICQVKQ